MIDGMCLMGCGEWDESDDLWDREEGGIMLRTGEVGVDEGARIAEGVRDAKVHRAGRVLRLSKTPPKIRSQVC